MRNREQARDDQREIMVQWHRRRDAIMESRDISVEEAILAMDRLFSELITAYDGATQRLAEATSQVEHLADENDQLHESLRSTLLSIHLASLDD